LTHCAYVTIGKYIFFVKDYDKSHPENITNIVKKKRSIWKFLKSHFSSFRVYDKMINNNCVSISLKMVKVRASTDEKNVKKKTNSEDTCLTNFWHGHNNSVVNSIEKVP